MIDVSQAVIGFFMMLGFMALGLHVAVDTSHQHHRSAVIHGERSPRKYGNQLWSFMNDFLLTSIPLFVLLGELLLSKRCNRPNVPNAVNLVGAVARGPVAHQCGREFYLRRSFWLVRSDGGDYFPTVALPEFRRRRYNERLVLGSIAAGAALGILIPPSVNLIIFGALTNTSIGQLFVAGIIPGIGLTLLFMASIILIARLYPSTAESSNEVIPFSVKLLSLVHLLPPALMFFVTMGAIYFGWATPTEAAGVGVVLALFIAGAYRGLSMSYFPAAFSLHYANQRALYFHHHGGILFKLRNGSNGRPRRP